MMSCMALVRVTNAVTWTNQLSTGCSDATRCECNVGCGFYYNSVAPSTSIITNECYKFIVSGFLQCKTACESVTNCYRNV